MKGGAEWGWGSDSPCCLWLLASSPPLSHPYTHHHHHHAHPSWLAGAAQAGDRLDRVGLPSHGTQHCRHGWVGVGGCGWVRLSLLVGGCHRRCASAFTCSLASLRLLTDQCACASITYPHPPTTHPPTSTHRPQPADGAAGHVCGQPRGHPVPPGLLHAAGAGDLCGHDGCAVLAWPGC